MTAEYHVNAEDEFLAVRLQGAVDLVEVYELARAILSDGAFDRAWPQLVDARGAAVQIRSGAMRPFAHYVVRQYRPQASGPMAVVIDGDVDGELTAAIFRLVCAMPDTEVFDDYALAIKWLLKRAWQRHNASLQPPDSKGNGTDETPEPVRTGERDEAGERFLAAAHGQLPHGDPGKSL